MRFGTPVLLSLTALSALSIIPPSEARAGEDPVAACLDASKAGQVQRDEGALLAAEEHFRRCAQASCPDVVRRDCATWLSEVQAAIPSLAVGARDETGRDLTDVRLYVDGELLLERLTGRAVELDPGPHRLRLVPADGREAKAEVVLKEGEKRRAMTVVIEAPDSSSPPSSFEVPAVTWALWGVGLAGGVAFGALAGVAKSDRDELQESCAPNCTEDQVDPIRHKLIAANVSLGVGIAALALGTGLMFLLQPEDDAPSARVRLSPGGASLALTF
ncbi:MAG: hypothetical protein JRI23_08990 [Deltaproteobacteria bacterium]|jgi:hypothetical protein|nr:hypothetical protein [Deltaproteobacteria bacterium]MBW2531773.1 hypothetical protein [Deltaproteobacteria bacterium]